MKGRVIQTRYWDDEKVVEFSSYAKYLYLYLLTCQYINISGVFQLSPKKIQFETALTEKQFADAQDELSREKKVLFYDGWVYVVNAEKNNNYRKIPSNEKTYQQELERVPVKVNNYFTSSLLVTDQSGIGETPNINKKQEIINKKSEEEEIAEFASGLFQRTVKVSDAWSKNFAVWRKVYSIEEIKKALISWKSGGWIWKTDGKDAGDLVLLFRTRNKAGECDYLDQLLNRKKPRYDYQPKVEIIETHEITDEERKQQIKNLEVAKNLFKKVEGGDI